MTPALALLDTSRRLICYPCSHTAGYVREAHIRPLFKPCWIRQGGSYVTPVLALLDTSRRLICDPCSSPAGYVKEAHM